MAAPSNILSGSWLPALPHFIPYFETTIDEVVAAYILAAILGITIGFLLGQNDYVYKVVQPFIVWGYSIPKIAIFPVFMLLFGLGASAVIVYATMSAFFVILLNTITGVRDVDKHLVTVSESLGMNTTQRYSKIMLPSMVPIVFSGLRQGLIQAVLGVLVSELVMAAIGVGSLIDNLSYAFLSTQLYAVIAMVALGMMSINLLLLRLEARLNFWRE
ncbi:MAG: ABC transporter permease subunit [Nitrososphaerota archaeon]|nr:ABC transporter permease subunit [Nitrososphaerota archaeon]